MISFAAIVPHHPILIPSIGQEKLDMAKQTVEAMEKLKNKLVKIKPDIIIIISPHGLIFADAFCLNLAEKYFGSLELFGDLTTKMEFKSDSKLTHRIRERFETANPPPFLTMISEQNLDYGVTVPLYYLTQKTPTTNDSVLNFSIIPISVSELDYQKHFEFGQGLKEEIMQSDKKIAIIASGDLSHALNQTENPVENKFDKQLIKFIKQKNTDKITNFDSNLVQEAKECGLRPIIVLLGILDNLNYKPEILSYEAPFGIGTLVAHFKIS